MSKPQPKAWPLTRSHVTRISSSEQRNIMSHVAHTNESCHTYEWVVPQIWTRQVIHMNGSCHTYEWVMAHIWMSHVTHTNETCLIYEWVRHVTRICPSKQRHTYWVMLHIQMSHGTHTNETCLIYEWVIPHIWTRQGMHMNGSCHTYKWVMSHMRMSHVQRMNASCHENECVMSHTWMSNESRPTYECIVTQMRKSHITRTKCEWFISLMYQSLGKASSRNISCRKWKIVQCNHLIAQRIGDLRAPISNIYCIHVHQTQSQRGRCKGV